MTAGPRKRLASWATSLCDRFPISVLAADAHDAVIMYHSIAGEPPLADSYGNVPPARLDRDLRYVSDAYAVTDLRSLVTEPDGRRKRVALTFDDGFRNFYTDALPLLHRYDAPATVFVTPGLIGEPSATAAAHELQSVDTEALLTERQLRELGADPLVTIGNHTNTHRDLTELSRDEQRREIQAGKARLEGLLGTSIRQFCYPYGKFNETSVSLVRERHDLAVTLTHGVVGRDRDPFRIPRLHGHASPLRLRRALLR